MGRRGPVSSVGDPGRRTWNGHPGDLLRRSIGCPFEPVGGDAEGRGRRNRRRGRVAEEAAKPWRPRAQAHDGRTLLAPGVTLKQIADGQHLVVLRHQLDDVGAPGSTCSKRKCPSRSADRARHRPAGRRRCAAGSAACGYGVVSPRQAVPTNHAGRDDGRWRRPSRAAAARAPPASCASAVRRRAAARDADAKARGRVMDPRTKWLGSNPSARRQPRTVDSGQCRPGEPAGTTPEPVLMQQRLRPHSSSQTRAMTRAEVAHARCSVTEQSITFRVVESLASLLDLIMSRDLDALTSSTLKHLREHWWDDAFTAFLERR